MRTSGFKDYWKMTNSTQLKQYQQAQKKMIIILTIMDMAIFHALGYQFKAEQLKWLPI